MSNLKNRLVKLGSSNPNLRKHIRPILEKLSARSVTAGAAHIKVHGTGEFSGDVYDVESVLETAGFYPDKVFADGNSVIVIFKGSEGYDEAAKAVKPLSRNYRNVSKAFRGGY